MTSEHLTPFEEQLAVALLAHVEAARLERPAEVVVDEVVTARRGRPPWLLPAGLAAVVLLVAAGLAGIRALDDMAASPAQATINGLTYGVVYDPSLSFPAADLTPYGRLSSGEEGFFLEPTAYAIRGVDPQVALAVPLLPGLRDGNAPPGDWALLVRGSAGRALCPYHDPEAGAVPAACLEEAP
ncbi:MAG: hypothetical protein ACRDHD_01835 [Candidatus Limnocylindria bacterium]